MKRGTLFAVLTLLIVLLSAQAAFGLSGAIFTTNADGTWVNGNTKYLAKEDVYLDGGPGPNAPVSAAALPAGDYYFQVTDPPGKTLLSLDPIESRKVRVNQYGVIDYIYPATVQTKYKGTWYGTHAQGVDADHGAAPWNAITAQLMPYADTPNNGGVYKVWMTPVSKYAPGQGKFGFIPSESKTDNYKVKGAKTPPVITVKKFHDLNANGTWDIGEPELTWWIDITEPGWTDPNTGDATPFSFIAAVPGTHSFTEVFPDVDPSWRQTALIIDGVAQAVSPTAYVTVAGTSGETHEVIFGNVQTVCVKGQKFYDADADGNRDKDEPPVEGIKLILTGTDVTGAAIGPDEKTTNSEGVAEWCDLLPGDYKVEEILPPKDWVATTPTMREATLAEGDVACFEFGNYCTSTVGFFTKGYWHNKNGIARLEEADRVFANGLAPYSTASDYFEAGDEPFDGLFADGSPVEAAFNNTDGSEIWAAGTWQAEVSQFLVDSNSGGDPREQLAQQLLAFVFNVRHQLPGAGASLVGPDGNFYGASSLIADAVDAWSGGSASERNHMAGLLDWFNNHHIDEGNGLQIVCGAPCYPIVY